MANQPEQNLSSESRGTNSGLDLETKIFSPSGRGGAFFLTFLFIELIEEIVSDNAVIANLVEDSASARNPKSLCTGNLSHFRHTGLMVAA
jgi:hypothetical protein